MSKSHTLLYYTNNLTPRGLLKKTLLGVLGVAAQRNDLNVLVCSQFANSEQLAFHILPDIVAGRVNNEATAQEWFSRTLASFQGVKPDFPKAFTLLKETQAITERGYRFEATPAGIISSKLYLHPADVWAWKRNFDSVFDLELEDDDHAIAWALGSVPVTRFSGDFGRNWKVVELARDGIPPGLRIMDGTITTITLWCNVLGGPSVGKMRNAAGNLRRDVGRICRALKMLDQKVAHWDMVDFFEELEFRCYRRIPVELAELCKLPGITKGKARYRSEHGSTRPRGYTGHN